VSAAQVAQWFTQLVHSLTPETGLYHPAGQAAQATDSLDAPMVTPYLPGLHRVHIGTPADVLYDRVGQAAHPVDSIDAPVAAPNLPGAHAVQPDDSEDAPAIVPYLPCAQGVQGATPPAPYCPTAHCGFLYTAILPST
jgi:hypothetical protein